MDQPRETICALASGPPPSAIAIIRISGALVPEICAQLLENGLPEPKKARLDLVKDLSGDVIDEGLVLYMAGPRSYTGEDSLELYLHGGQAVIEHVLTTLTAMENVRLAEPGEFTRRAFENGKLDLTEAEGVADVIEAETRAQKSQALRQLGGALSETYRGWQTALTEILALLEVSIDFPDEGDAPQTVDAPSLKRIHTLRTEIESALGDNGIGERIRDGFRIAIIGAPNAGKSTLLNRLAGRDAAIVTDIPGTTRDVIEVRRVMGGAVIWFADTAGLRETDDVIEAEGVRRAEAVAAEADLRIYLVDAEDRTTPPPSKAHPSDLIVLNKVDKTGHLSGQFDLSMSAKTGEYVEALEARITDWVQSAMAKHEAPVITRARHRAGLTASLTYLQSACERIETGEGAELAAEDVRLAARALSSLVGEVGVEDVLGAVFSEFCIGK